MLGNKFASSQFNESSLVCVCACLLFLSFHFTSRETHSIVLKHDFQSFDRENRRLCLVTSFKFDESENSSYLFVKKWDRCLIVANCVMNCTMWALNSYGERFVWWSGITSCQTQTHTHTKWGIEKKKQILNVWVKAIGCFTRFSGFSFWFVCLS